MAVIASIDGVARRIYLHADTVGVDVHPIDVYTAMRTFRRTDEELRKYELFLSGHGKDPKSTGKFTERFVKMLLGTRIVPYDVTQRLSIVGTIITDDGQEGIDCFDRSSLSAGVEVDIDYQPPQVEVVEISSGSGLSTEEHDQLMSRPDEVEISDELLSADPSAYSQGTVGSSLNDISYTDKFVFVNTELAQNGDGKSGSPFNNTPDAVDFLELMGWRKLIALSDITLERTMKNFTIEGVGLPTIDFDGQNVDKSVFTTVKLTGKQVGFITCREVVLASGLSDLNGVYKECGLIAGATYTVVEDGIVNITQASILAFTPIILPTVFDLGAATTNAILSMRKLSGGIEVINVNTATKVATLLFAGGKCILDASCTSGIIGIGGLVASAITNNSNGSIVNTDDIFPSVDTIMEYDRDA